MLQFPSLLGQSTVSTVNNILFIMLQFPSLLGQSTVDSPNIIPLTELQFPSLLGQSTVKRQMVDWSGCCSSLHYWDSLQLHIGDARSIHSCSSLHYWDSLQCKKCHQEIHNSCSSLHYWDSLQFLQLEEMYYVVVVPFTIGIVYSF